MLRNRLSVSLNHKHRFFKVFDRLITAFGEKNKKSKTIDLFRILPSFVLWKKKIWSKVVPGTRFDLKVKKCIFLIFLSYKNQQTFFFFILKQSRLYKNLSSFRNGITCLYVFFLSYSFLVSKTNTFKFS